MKITARIILVCILIVAVAGAVCAAEKKQGPGAQWDRSANRGPSFIGTVTNISATSITVQQKDSQKTFAINSNTKVMMQGKKAKITDIKTGNTVAVGYTASADNVLTATRIVVPRPTFSGQVTAIQGNTIVISGKDKVERKVICSANTKFRSHGYAGSIADIKVKYTVKATGDINNNTINADIVEFIPLMARGNVTAIDGSTITVKTPKKGDISLKTSAATVINIRKENEPVKTGTLADIKVGQTISAGYQPVQSGPAPVLWIEINPGM